MCIFLRRKKGTTLKIIDKFLKVLNTDRNTFVTYILTLITIYLAIDRIVEILFIFFTGMSVSYWGPFQYLFALACPVFAFYFSGPSKFIKNDKTKISFFYLYCIALYIIGISMLIQWLNRLGWLLVVSVPNYPYIATNMPEIFGPAFKSISIYILILTVPMLFKFLYMQVNDTKDIIDSILDYGGLNLTVNKEGTGPYTCEVAICKDKSTGKIVKVPEARRFEVSLIVGVSGTGKTTMVFEPMIARDIEKKHFFRSVGKELAFTALKNGIATLNCPYTNEYINDNFNMNMITPNPNKDKVYKGYMKNMIYDASSERIIYRNLGITYLAPDAESISHVTSIANNFNVKYNLIDPNNENSIGLNPFIYDNPTKTAIVISSVIRGMYKSIDLDNDEVIKENVALQAVENLSLLLKEMYPRLHDGLLPNLEDMLKMLNNFELVEKMCNILEEDPDLAEQYAIQLGYFKRHFYKNGTARVETEKNVVLAITQIDNLLRYPGVKRILCNRSNNINFDKALENGEVTFICTQRGDLGETAHKAFGLFSILLLQHSVLSRPGNERNRIPHFLYIDEFASFVCEATTPIFTLYRKYRVGAIISSQNLSQFSVNGNDDYKKTILANSTTKMVFGNNTPEDNKWWEDEFGKKRKWNSKRDYNLEKGAYEDKLGGIEYGWTSYANAGKIQTLKFKSCIYKTKDIKGASQIGDGAVDFLEPKYKEHHSDKMFKFDKFNKTVSSSDASTDDEEDNNKKNKFDYKKVNFDVDDDVEVDPIQTDLTSSSLFDNQDAISFDFNKKDE